jgi:sulfonate transport system ATP-binding protein
MHALLRTLCEKHKPAVLLVTHDVDEAIVLADRVILLDDGVVRADVRVDLARRSQAELRGFLLDELGVDAEDQR